jgi:hypothetical protein
MKTILYPIFLFFIIATAFSQQQSPSLIIHKTNGATQDFLLSDIQSITFSSFAINDTLGLIAWYPFDGNTDDLTGHGYNGTNNGAIYIADRFSDPDKALHFSGGGSSYITTSNSGNIALNDSFSICFWIKYENYGILIEKDIVGTFTTDWNTQCDATGKLGFQFGSASILWSNGTINDNNWHYVVFLRNRSTGVLKMYIDGNLDRQFIDQNNNLTGTANVNIGAWENPTNFTDGFTGSLDDIRFYLRELTESEIQSLYHAGGW